MKKVNQQTPVVETKKSTPSPKVTFEQVITAIRQLEPEDQNGLISELLYEIGKDRQNTYNSTRNANDRAAKNANEFMVCTQHLEKRLAEGSQIKL